MTVRSGISSKRIRLPGITQGFDRFAYVNNNPIKYTVPSGHGDYSGDDYDPANLGSDEELDALNTMKRALSKPINLLVELENYRAYKQYEEPYLSALNCLACGVTAYHGSDVIRNQLISSADDPSSEYNGSLGIQPTGLYNLYESVLGSENISMFENMTMADYYNFLENGYQILVDIMVNRNGDYVGNGPESSSHFAPIIGMNWSTQTFYIGNTLPGDEYWTVSYSALTVAGTDPENSAELKPKYEIFGVNPETVINWTMILAP